MEGQRGGRGGRGEGWKERGSVCTGVNWGTEGEWERRMKRKGGDERRRELFTASGSHGIGLLSACRDDGGSLVGFLHFVCVRVCVFKVQFACTCACNALRVCAQMKRCVNGLWHRPHPFSPSASSPAHTHTHTVTPYPPTPHQSDKWHASRRAISRHRSSV